MSFDLAIGPERHRTNERTHRCTVEAFSSSALHVFRNMRGFQTNPLYARNRQRSEMARKKRIK